MPLPFDNDQSSVALTQFLPLTGIYPSPGGGSSGILLGSVRTFAGNFATGGSATAEGQIIQIAQNTVLFSLFGTTYGGDGQTTFALPDLDGRTMIGRGQGIGLSNQIQGAAIGLSSSTLLNAQLPASLGGSGQPFDNHQPSLPITYLIRTEGIFPSQDGGTGGVDFIGEIVPFAGSFVPGGFMECAGQLLSIADNETLFTLIGTTYGGDRQTTFALPDLRGRDIVGTSSQLPIGSTEGTEFATLTNANLPVNVGGSGQPIDNREPSLALTYLIALQGIFPSSDGGSVDPNEQYLGEVVAFAGNFAPKGWVQAAGQILPIAQNQALFSLLGTTYGGDGRTTFALPDLRDRTAIGTGDTAHSGDAVGSNSLTISSANIPDVSVTGTGNPDTLYGADGNDFLNGAGGADTMIGNLGNNSYVVDSAGDVVVENTNAGTDIVVTTLTSYTLGANLENLAYNGAASFSGTGNSLNNTIIGGAASDILTGAGGNDTLQGGIGADTMTGGTGNDGYFVDNAGDAVVENANEGADTVYVAFNYFLQNNVETLVLQGAAGLQGYGNALANTLYGNTGNNLLDGGAGADGMFGGAGNDTYFVDNMGDAAIENANEGNDSVFATANFTLGANVESLILQGAANLQGYGNGLANTIYGNTGDNLLNGFGGVDLMAGGTGNDVYYVDDPGDACFEVATQGNDAVFASCSYVLAADVESLILQGIGGFQAYGNNQANTIYGNSGNNLINPGGGIDLMAGGAGNDIYYVNDPSDVCFEVAGQGNDAVFATCSYGLEADVETLILQGSADLQGYGNNTANTIYGNAGNNLLNGGGGGDTMVGGAGNNVYFVDNAGDGIIENTNEGNDAVFAGVSYALGANIEGLVLQGAANLDGFGNAIANSIAGNTGNNKLDGGDGADQLTGNAGNDTFVFNVGQGNGDVVVDFAGNGAAAGDALQFIGYGAGATFTNIDANHWQVNYNGNTSHDIITFSNGAPIDPTDYLFV